MSEWSPFLYSHQIKARKGLRRQSRLWTKLSVNWPCSFLQATAPPWLPVCDILAGYTGRYTRFGYTPPPRQNQGPRSWVRKVHWATCVEGQRTRFTHLAYLPAATSCSSRSAPVHSAPHGLLWPGVAPGWPRTRKTQHVGSPGEYFSLLLTRSRCAGWWSTQFLGCRNGGRKRGDHH